MTKMDQWKQADRISNRIGEILDDEIRSPHSSPVQIFAGQMLAMLSMLHTAEGLPLPPELIAVRAAIENCLRAMTTENRREAH
jgi:hypothetical protein